MSKKLLLLFFLLPVFVDAQNLVLNPSFEDTVQCPNDISQVFNAQHWSSYSPTPDYFNSCSTITSMGQLIVSVPQNICGYQNAFDGNAYCGLQVYGTPPQNLREIIGGELSSTLIPGTKYYAGVWVCLAEHSVWATNKIGIAFSTVQYSDITMHAPVNNQAVVYSDSIISDSVNWVPIRGYFIADSTYKYIMAGNFFTDSNTDTITANPSQIGTHQSYYYVDGIYTSTDSLCCYTSNSNSINDNQLFIFPNPSFNKLNIKSPLESSEIMIYNLLGQEILKSNKSQKELSIDISTIPDGMYFLIEQSKNKILKQKFLIQK